MNGRNIYLDMELPYKFYCDFGSILALKILDEVHRNIKSDEYEEKTHKCVPENSQINLFAQEFE